MFQVTENRVLEEQVLFPSSNGADLYGVLYHARDEKKGAIVVCSPEGDERIWSQRVLVNFSRLLAAHGYSVLRFDYMGQGESEGTYEESTISTRREDVESAIGFLLERTRSAQAGLLGLRLGGAIACLAASRNSSVNSLALWEPVTDLRAYLYNLLRVNVSFQMVMNKGISKNREKLVEEILAGGKVSINGFYLTKDFIQEALGTKLEGILNPVGKRFVALLPGTPFPAEGGGEILRLDFPVIWKEPKVYHARPRALMEETLKWIRQNNV
jgi:alpha/beta superfamily hydrolase